MYPFLHTSNAYENQNLAVDKPPRAKLGAPFAGILPTHSSVHIPAHCTRWLRRLSEKSHFEVHGIYFCVKRTTRQKLDPQNIGVRFPPELLARIDQKAQELSRQRGIPVTRTTTIRELVHLALQQEAQAA